MLGLMFKINFATVWVTHKNSCVDSVVWECRVKAEEVCNVKLHLICCSRNLSQVYLLHSTGKQEMFDQLTEEIEKRESMTFMKY